MVNAGRILIIAKGAWGSTVSYQQLDLVSYDNKAYLARQASVGVNPSTDASMTYWQPFGTTVEPDSETIVTNEDGQITVNIDGETLVYDTNDEVLKAVLGITDLTDIAISNVSNGQVLVYNSTSQKWENTTLNLTTNLSSLSDVTITTPTDGQVLSYNSSSSEWVNADASGGLLPHLIIISDTGSTVTVTKGSTVITAPETSTGHFECDIPEFGTWTIDAVLSGDDAQMSLVVDTVKIYTVDDSHFHASITVTFPSGATCRCQGGSENYYTSTTPYTFTVHSANTYTITATDGTATDTETVTITTSGQTESVTLTFIPNGSTVVPTDNIQTWLHCADIWNKSYTTLAEVLADASTLQALIASSNAVDYMVRSTTWASDVTADSSAMSYIGLDDYCADTLLADSTWCNAICNSTYFENVLTTKMPTMTGESTPSNYSVIASSVYQTYYPWKASDGVYATAEGDSTNRSGWISNGAAPQWIYFKFSQTVCIKKMVFWADMLNTDTANRDIKNYKIQVSTNGTDWTDIGNTRTLAKQLSNVVALSENNSKYAYYRIYVYDTYGSGENVDLLELQMYGRA